MKQWWDYVRQMEPARLRAAWAAVIAVFLALGITISADVDRAVQAVIVAVCALIPILQGESTRRKVTPTTKVEAEIAAAEGYDAIDPGLQDSSDPDIGADDADAFVEEDPADLADPGDEMIDVTDGDEIA